MDLRLPATKKQLAKLGERLASDQASDQDWDLYGAMLDVYDQIQVFVRNELDRSGWDVLLGREAEIDISGRAKTLDTLVQKLRRTPGLKLPYIRDIAGVRLVGDFTLTEQTRVAERVRDVLDCPDAALVDRREVPESGYRALHVIATVNGISVEVQIRTRLQGLWADVFERTADTWGRQIRYGEAPDPAPDELVDGYAGPTRAMAVARLVELSVRGIAELELITDTLAVLNALIASDAYQVGVKSGSFPDDDMPEGMKTPDQLESRVQRMQRDWQARRKAMEAELIALAERAEQDAHASALRDRLVNVEEQS